MKTLVSLTLDVETAQRLRQEENQSNFVNNLLNEHFQKPKFSNSDDVIREKAELLNKAEELKALESKFKEREERLRQEEEINKKITLQNNLSKEELRKNILEEIERQDLEEKNKKEEEVEFDYLSR